MISDNALTCTETSALVNGIGAGARTTASSAVETITGLTSFLLPVTVTAGLEKLTGGSDAGSGHTVRPTQTVGSAPFTVTKGTGPSNTSKSTAGVPRVTQQAVLAGVAAVVGGVMMI